MKTKKELEKELKLRTKNQIKWIKELPNELYTKYANFCAFYPTFIDGTPMNSWDCSSHGIWFRPISKKQLIINLKTGLETDLYQISKDDRLDD